MAQVKDRAGNKSIDLLVSELRLNAANVRFVDAVKVASWFFGDPRQKSTSHVVFHMPWAADPRVNLQRGKNGKAKPYQIKQLLLAIDRLVSQEKENEDGS